MEHTDPVSELLKEFSSRLRAAVAAEFMAKLGMAPGGRMTPNGSQARPKRPPRLCPVPGCPNVAAPIYGMLCRDHKDRPKKEIEEYRAAARDAKNGTPPPAASAPAKPPAAKPPAAKRGRRPAVPIK